VAWPIVLDSDEMGTFRLVRVYVLLEVVNTHFATLLNHTLRVRLKNSVLCSRAQIVSLIGLATGDGDWRLQSAKRIRRIQVQVIAAEVARLRHLGLRLARLLLLH